MSRKKIKKKKRKFSFIEKEIVRLAAQGKNLDEIMLELDIDVFDATEILFKIQKSIMRKGG